MLPRRRRAPEARAGVTDGGQAGIGFGPTALGAIALDAKRRPLSLRYAPVVEPRFSDIVRDISAARRLPEIPTTETPGIGLN
jgi:hypothetical protein